MIDLVGALSFATLGLLAWPPVEYWIHRWLHVRQSPVAGFHQEHHLTPARVFTTPLVWVPIAAILILGGSALAGPWGGGAFAVGLVAGFLRYEIVHYRIHFCAPATASERRRREHHLAHHFRKPRAYFAVSSPLWDRVFGTLPDAHAADYAAVARHPTLREPSNLGILVPRRRPSRSASRPSSPPKEAP